MSQPIRQFATGATRDADTNKADYEGFLSPLALRRYGEYMNRHRKQSDGSLRDSDNWQRGIPLDAYIKSGFRHFMDWWSAHRGLSTSTGESIEEELCALIFNASGYLHELLKAKQHAGQCIKGHREVVSGDALEAIRREIEETSRSKPLIPRNDDMRPIFMGHHPMHAESLRDEFQRDDAGTGV